MTIYEGLTIFLIVFGILCIVISFFIDTSKGKDNTGDMNANKQSHINLDEEISIVNDKILELNEFAEFVKDEMDRKHKELIFLYQMVSEKEKLINSKAGFINENIPNNPSISNKDNKKSTIIVDPYNNTNITKEIKSEVLINKNEKILKLSKKGYSIKEIAQLLDIGQGEVKLVLDLFK